MHWSFSCLNVLKYTPNSSIAFSSNIKNITNCDSAVPFDNVQHGFSLTSYPQNPTPLPPYVCQSHFWSGNFWWFSKTLFLTLSITLMFLKSCHTLMVGEYPGWQQYLIMTRVSWKINWSHNKRPAVIRSTLLVTYSDRNEVDIS